MRRMYETSLQLVDVNSVEEARILCFFATLLESMGRDTHLIFDSCARARDLARIHRDPNLEMRALQIWARATNHQGEYGAALSLIRESEQVIGYDDLFPPQEICELAGYIFAFYNGDTEKACKYLEEGHRIATITRMRHQTAALGIIRLYRELGKWDKARRFVVAFPEAASHPFIIAHLAAIEFETGWDAAALAIEIPDLVRGGADRSHLDIAETAAIEFLESLNQSGMSKSWTSRFVTPFLAFNSALRGDVDLTRERYAGVEVGRVLCIGAEFS